MYRFITSHFREFYILVNVSLITSLIVPFFTYNSSMVIAGRSGTRSDYQVSFGYMNDNFISVRTFEPVLNVGKDDNITASFWLQLTLKSAPPGISSLNIYHSIITNKDENYRTDLLTIYPSITQSFGRVKVGLGLGLMARGNFGGENIQSWYHDARGLTPVELPYANAHSTGLFLMNELDYKLLDNGYYSGTYVIHIIKNNSGPGILKLGLDFNSPEVLNKPVFSLQFQLTSGYMDCYAADRYLSPIFGSGFYQALAASLIVKEKSDVTVWISRNKYGLNQTHFGVTLAYGNRLATHARLRDVLFP